MPHCKIQFEPALVLFIGHVSRWRGPNVQRNKIIKASRILYASSLTTEVTGRFPAGNFKAFEAAVMQIKHGIT